MLTFSLIKKGEKVTGVEFEHSGHVSRASGPVIIATGGYAADHTYHSLLEEANPLLMNLSTTNGPGSQGFGHRMVRDVGGALTQIDQVQIHPTAFVNQSDPDNKTKFLAGEAMRGTGAILLDKQGNRFVNEVEKRSVVSEAMLKNDKSPYWQLFGGDAAEELSFFVSYYTSVGLMFKAETLEDTAKLMNISDQALKTQINEYIDIAEGHKKDPFGRTHFPNHNLTKGPWLVARVTPAVHYTMGGIKIDGQSRVLASESGDCKLEKPIPGLFAAGEAGGGVHGVNRLGGSGLLTTIVFGRQAADSAAAYLLEELTSNVAHQHHAHVKDN